MEPKYTLPSRQHFSEKEVPQLYLDVASQVKDALKGKHVALTTDGWTSKATQSYITIMCVHTSFKTAFFRERGTTVVFGCSKSSQGCSQGQLCCLDD